MNQILSVSIEKNKKKSKMSFKATMVLFAIILIIFGLGITGSGSYSFYNILKEKADKQLLINNSKKPDITTERENANTINIVVAHDKEIIFLSYTINGNEEIEINTNNSSNIKQPVILKAGTNNVKIFAKDRLGITANYDATVEVEENGPIITLTQEEGKVRAVTQSTGAKIDKISYYWDNKIENATTLTINDEKNETLIDVTEAGIHELHVEAIDTDGKKTHKKQMIEGVSKPEIDITTDGTYFYIKARDQQGLDKVEIKLNNDDTISEKLENCNEYNKKITLENGENRLTVTVYNNKEMSEVSRVKYTKE